MSLQQTNPQQIMASISEQTNEVKSACENYMSFGTKEFNKACVSFQQLQQSNGSVNYCALAQTYNQEVVRRQRSENFDEQLVCQTIYTIELMGKIRDFLQTVLDDTRFDNLNAALQKVISSQQASGCSAQLQQAKQQTVVPPVVQERQIQYYIRVGAFKDQNIRALRFGPPQTEYGYNSETCSLACASYKYFALQNGGQCFCDNDFKSVTKYGRDNCGQLGGGWCNYVYEQFNLTQSQLSKTNSIVPLGSFKDESNRALRYGPGEKSSGYSQERCSDACKDYTYFALQYGGQCYCDNDFAHATKYKLAQCDQNGGSWCNFIYKKLK